MVSLPLAAPYNPDPLSASTQKNSESITKSGDEMNTIFSLFWNIAIKRGLHSLCPHSYKIVVVQQVCC